MTSYEQNLIFTEVANGKDDIDQASGSNECKRIEKKIFLSEYYTDILQPQIVDVGQCLSSTDGVQCVPSKYKMLEVLRKEDNRPSIQTLKNFIITECSPSMYNTTHNQSTSAA